MVSIDPLSATSLRVTPKFAATSLASATAFTVEHDGRPFLLTNWHVVSGRDADTDECLDKKFAGIPDSLEVRFHAQHNLGAWVNVDISLLPESGTKGWLEHPQGRHIDVVAIPIPENVVNKIAVYPLDLKLAATDILAMPAQPVSVIGYPLGLSTAGNWPIWKTGHIASDPDLNFESGRPAFLIDATTRSGMSGSPVVLRLDSFQTKNGSQVLAGGIQTRFMGVYSGRIHEQSEIGRVWRPNVIEELFKFAFPLGSISCRIASNPFAPR